MESHGNERPVPLVEGRGVRRLDDAGQGPRQRAERRIAQRRAGRDARDQGPERLGENTLLNCLSGLDSIDASDVLIEGRSLAGMSDRDRTDYRARRMGFVFQFYNLMPVLTAVENVELPMLVAWALVNEPAIVWADEPTGDLVPLIRRHQRRPQHRLPVLGRTRAPHTSIHALGDQSGRPPAPQRRRAAAKRDASPLSHRSPRTAASKGAVL